MRAFVTGGTGFLGGYLIRELLAHGYTVSALVRTFERARQLPEGVRALPGDITKPESLRAGLREADVVFHCAGLTDLGLRPKDQARVQRINADGARHLLALAVEAGAAKIVHVSCVDVYGDTRGQAVDEGCRPAGAPTENFAQRSRREAHVQVAQILQARGAPLVIACLGALYGPGDGSQVGHWLRRHARGRLPIMAGPDSARSWTYVADAALGLRLTAEAGRAGETYHLAGPAHTLRDFFQACARATGAPAPLVWLPSPLMRALGRALDRPLPALAERLRTASGVTYLASSLKAERELGWQARPLAEGLAATFADLREA